MKLTPNSFYIDIILNALKGKKFNSVLEVACGSCQNLIVIQKKYRDVKLKGFDLGTKTEHPGIEVEIGNLTADKWPFEGEKFDVVFSMASLITLPSKGTFHWMKKLTEITNDYLIFIEWHNDEAPITGKVYDYSRPYTIRNYRKLLMKYKFRDIKEIKYPGNIWPDWGLKEASIIWGEK